MILKTHFGRLWLRFLVCSFFLSLLFFILTDTWVSLCAIPFLSNHDLTLVSGLSGLSQAQTDGSTLDSNADLKINPPKQTSFSQAEPAASWIRTTAKRFNMCKWLPMIAFVSLTNININQLATDDPWVAHWLEICWKCFTTVFCETALPCFVAWPLAGSRLFCLLGLWVMVVSNVKIWSLAVHDFLCWM